MYKSSRVLEHSYGKGKGKRKRKRKKRESYKTVDFGQDRKRVEENRRENEWEKCLVRREKGREK